MKTFFVSKMVFDFSNVVIVCLDSYWGSPYRTPNVILKYMFTLSIAVNPRRWRKSLNISAKYVKVKFCKICFFFLVTLSILEEGRDGFNYNIWASQQIGQLFCTKTQILLFLKIFVLQNLGVFQIPEENRDELSSCLGGFHWTDELFGTKSQLI